MKSFFKTISIIAIVVFLSHIAPYYILNNIVYSKDFFKEYVLEHSYDIELKDIEITDLYDICAFTMEYDNYYYDNIEIKIVKHREGVVYCTFFVNNNESELYPYVQSKIVTLKPLDLNIDNSNVSELDKKIYDLLISKVISTDEKN